MKKIISILEKWRKKRKQIKPLRHSFHSSFIFLTNALSAFYMGYYLYSFLFVGLFISSVLFHSIMNVYTTILDQVCIYSVIGYGTYLFYSKTLYIPTLISFLIIKSFLLTAYLFFYGFFMKAYCFDEDKNIGELYHGLFHLISSCGHHLIALYT